MLHAEILSTKLNLETSFESSAKTGQGVEEAFIILARRGAILVTRNSHSKQNIAQYGETLLEASFCCSQ
jgi:hypothetical protein